jgi:hypothetical protein
MGQESQGMIRNTEDPDSTGQPPDTSSQTTTFEVNA